MLRYLLEKEFKQILRNPFLSRILLAMPLMTIVLFPYVTNQEVRDVKVSIVDNDRSPASQRLAQKVAGSGYFRLADTPTDYQQALQGVEAGQADIVLEIPRHFERSLVRGEAGQVMVSANSVDGIRGGLGTQYLSTIVADFAAELRQEAGLAAAGAAVPLFRTEVRYRFNPTLDYKVFMVPGLMVMLVTLLCCSLTALNIVGEKEAGTIEQINVTPVPKSLFILSKLLPNWIIGFLALAFGMLFAWAVHGIVPQGNPDHIAASSARNYGEYDISGVTDLQAGSYQTAHGGYDQTYANQDPDRVLPVDVLRDLEKEGRIGKLHHLYYATVGNGTAVSNARKWGAEIGAKLREANVQAVILTST